MNKNIIIALSIMALLLIGTGYWSYTMGQSSSTTTIPLEPKEATQQASTNVLDIEKMMEDRPQGNTNAPITFIEYASMTCPHCADFNNRLLPEIKKELIDTGKIRMIFRDFPLDRYAVKASMLSRCAPPEKYHEIVDILFKEQSQWIKSESPIKSLAAIGARMGMDDGFIGTCLGSIELEEAIIKRMQDAQNTLHVERTPSFFFKKGDETIEMLPEFDAILRRNPPPEHKH